MQHFAKEYNNHLIAYELGSITRNDMKKSFEYFQIAAKGGVSGAFFQIG